MKKTATLFLFLFTASCGDADTGPDSELETTNQSLTRTKYKQIVLHAPSKRAKVGPRDLSSVPDVKGTYTCCDSDNNCYDIDLNESCEAGETLLWCMGDGLCAPTNTD